MTGVDAISPVDRSRLRAKRVWVALLLLTITMAALAESGYRGSGLAALLLCAAFAKGTLVADHFMGLRRVRRLWRTIVLGYLLVIAIGIGVAYRMSVA